jgi:hypothetical protein
MKLQIPWENNGLRLMLTIESKSLQTHSKMQSLAEEDKYEISELGKDVLSRTCDLIKSKNEL